MASDRNKTMTVFIHCVGQRKEFQREDCGAYIHLSDGAKCLGHGGFHGRKGEKVSWHSFKFHLCSIL